MSRREPSEGVREGKKEFPWLWEREPASAGCGGSGYQEAWHNS